MSDPSNASLWADADVYIAPAGTAAPANIETEFGVAWELVGLLSGEAGFAYNHEEQQDDHYAWGGVLVRTSRRNFKQTVSFTALEDNEATRSLIWPGSSPGSLVVPRPARIKIAFETREGSKVRRLIAAYQAEVAVPTWTDSEGSLTEYELVATIFPDTQTDPPTLFIEQFTDGTSA